MKIKINLIVFAVLGLILISLLPPSYGAVSLESSGINGGTNSTSSGFKLLSTVGQIAGFLSSTSFQLFSGFLPTTQGGNAVPADLLSGLTFTVTDGVVTVPLSTSTSGEIDFTEIAPIVTVGGEDQITTTRDISFTDNGIGATILITGGTTITADTGDWDGSFEAPLFLGLTSGAGGGDVTTLAIRLGATGIDFTLDDPVRITFAGHAGQNAALIDKNGIVTEITLTCLGSDFTTVDAQLGPDEACKFSSDGNLVVWTKHLSTFYSFVRKTGGGFMDIEGPSFTQNFNEGENPLVIGSTVFPKLGFYNEKTETATVNIGTQVPFRLLMSENIGPQNVQHVALYMNLYGATGTETHKSDTWIVFEKNRDIEIHDPRGFIDEAYTSTATKGDKFETSFYITFAKPMQKSNLIIVTWDNDRNGMTSTVLDAFAVIDPKAEATKQQKEATLDKILQEVQEKEEVVVETLQEVKEKELALVYAISKYGTASTETQLAQKALDKIENEAEVAQEALDVVKEEAKIAQEALDKVENEATMQQKDTVVAEAIQKVQEKELAVVAATEKYGTDSLEAKAAQEALDEAKDELSKANSVETQAVEPTPEPGVETMEPGVDVMAPDQKETIQKWAGYHVTSASDSELLSVLNIKVDSEPDLPNWAKNSLAKWALDEKISMKEFINAIKYFVKK